MSVNINEFRARLLEPPVFDADMVHHEFVSGKHGQKLDFGEIPDNSDFFHEWVDINAEAIRNDYRIRDNLGSLAIVSVATGTDRLVDPVSAELGNRALPIKTEKVGDAAVKLGSEAIEKLKERNIRQAVILEDVSTTGGTPATAVLSLRSVEIQDVIVQTTFQRARNLPKLEMIFPAMTSYRYMRPLIRHPLDDYTPEQCVGYGFCAKDWKFIPRNRSTPIDT